MSQYAVFPICLCVFFAILASATPTEAHRVNVFAWVEGTTVHTESFFPDGTKATNARIEIFGPDNTLLLKGTTDENGRYVFESPSVGDLKIVLNDSLGHRAEYDLSASEFGRDKADTEAGAGPARPGVEHLADSKDVHTHTHARVDEGHGHPVLSDEHIKALLAQVLEEKLAPIRAKLAAMETRGLRLSEILGGLGYIIGLVGVGLYVKSRTKNS